MSVRVWLDSITFSDGTKVDLEKDQILVIVGPNNSGKSATLNEVYKLVNKNTFEKRVVHNLSIVSKGEQADIEKYLSDHSMKIDNSTDIRYTGYDYSCKRKDLHLWGSKSIGLSIFREVLVGFIRTENRLETTKAVKNFKAISEPPQHPIHILHFEESRERFSNYIKRAFDNNLIVNYGGGSEFPVHIGEKPEIYENEDRVSISYLKRLEKLPLLHEQGDGMRSFIGVLLLALMPQYQIVMIDEPEAFLHPPQARIMGKMLGQEKPDNRQYIIATHSIDIIKGLLESESQNIKIIRLQREGNVNHVTELGSSDIMELWGDPLLRFSNIIDGVFHSKVIICEADSDCRFYSAVLNCVCEDKIPDFQFVHCGGKDRIPVVIRALRKLNVITNVIVDIDILNTLETLQKIFTESGGNWQDIEKDCITIKKAIEQKRPEINHDEFKSEIREILDSICDQQDVYMKMKEIKKTLKRTSAWNEAKHNGKSFIPNGDATKAFNRISSKLQERGICIVEVGELEGFVREVGGHGPSWVVDVLSRFPDLKHAVELEIARNFVKQLLD